MGLLLRFGRDILSTGVVSGCFHGNPNGETKMNATETRVILRFVFNVWVRTGPRDQTNCMNGWGKRAFEVFAQSHNAALTEIICRFPGQVERKEY